MGKKKTYDKEGWLLPADKNRTHSSRQWTHLSQTTSSTSYWFNPDEMQGGESGFCGLTNNESLADVKSNYHINKQMSLWATMTDCHFDPP